nr:hypothetical protein [Bacteroides sp.]
MQTDYQNLDLLKEAVERKFGSTPNSPTDFVSLSTDIQTATTKSLGISTLKRVWGYVKSSHAPTYTTLSVLARYAGFRDWYAFCAQCGGNEESGFSEDSVIVSADLECGAIVRAEWGGEKWCTLRKTEHPTRFVIVDAHNIKLRAGDAGTVNTLSIADKFVMTDCERGGVRMGTYIGAKSEGITSIKHISAANPEADSPR